MNAEPKPINPAVESEPTSTSDVVPMWLIALLLLALFWAALSFDRYGGWFQDRVYGPFVSIAHVEQFQPATGGGEAVFRRGKALFEANCALCHGSDGNGKPTQGPPLAGSEWVISPGVNRLIRIPRVGLAGPITVKGEPWNLNMAAMAPMSTHSPEDLAAILTYIRQSWGNKASEVTPEQVEAVDAELADHPQQYTAEELSKLPE
jgi:mono/diheme cytochrome c family protein